MIGILLGVPTGELDIIEAEWPTNIKRCCDHMLEKWLEMDTTASLEKIHTAIESPAMSSMQASKGKHFMRYMCLII